MVQMVERNLELTTVCQSTINSNHEGPSLNSFVIYCFDLCWFLQKEVLFPINMLVVSLIWCINLNYWIVCIFVEVIICKQRIFNFWQLSHVIKNINNSSNIIHVLILLFNFQQRALRAETTVSKLKEEVKILKVYNK